MQEPATPFEKSAQTPEVLDAKGLFCPLPILKAKKALSRLESGQHLVVLTTDQNAKRDFANFCRQSGNPLLEQIEQPDGSLAHKIQRR